MPNIKITVAGKIATNATPGEVIVCGNSDYTVTFSFDSEWTTEAERTARFLYYKNGLTLFQDIPFTGDTVAAPVLSNINYVLVGVYAGNLRTTTPAKVLCDRSILCGESKEVLTPEEMELLQSQISEVKREIAKASAWVEELERKLENGELTGPAGPQGIPGADATNFSYGTTDLVAGTSELATGHLYYVYE